MYSSRNADRGVTGRLWWLIQLSSLLFVNPPGFAQANYSPSSVDAASQFGVVRARVAQRADMQDLVALRGNVHPLARAEYDQGVAPDDLPMARMLLVLKRGEDQEIALRQLLEDQQVRSNAQYHQWLTPEDFGQRFGPADADIQAVTDWLSGQGFQVNRVAAGRTVIEFSGTAGQVRQALQTEVHKFAVRGEEHWANASDPQIPAALAPVVAGIVSLHNFPKKPQSRALGTFSRSKLTGEVQPLFTFPAGCRSGSGPCYIFAVGPADFATIYNVAPLWAAGIDGTGQTIAVVGETNINPADVADFRSMFGLPFRQPNIILNGPDPGINGDEMEADLDVQWAGAVAKGSTIDFVVSESTETTAGIDLSALYIVDHNLAPIMSESYGACEAALGSAGNRFYSTLWEQAAAQGITVLMASGDAGSAGCDSANAGETVARYGLGVSGIASTPFNVAVGGTDFNDPATLFNYWNTTNTSPSQSSAKSYIPESTWNDSCAAAGSLSGCGSGLNSTLLNAGYYLLAGGGGPSSCINPTGTFPAVTCSGKYAKPSWQSGVGVPSDGARDIPDVSLFAGNDLNFSFYVVCQMDANAYGNPNSCDLNSPYTNFQGGSGTSASVQAFAGIMALVTQRYGRQGNANYVLYPMAAKSGASCNSSTAPVSNSSCVFYDITVGNNSVICPGGSPNCSSTGFGQYGIMVSGGSPAYATTAGHDLATGLGSVNVANLINNWTSNFTTSMTTLSLSTNPATNPLTLMHGQSVDFTVNVAPGSGSGIPTGDVSLIAQTSTSQSSGIGPFTLGGGSVSGSTAMLPGGSYSVTAHYAGNGIFAASDSTPGIPVTVGKESSLTSAQLATFNPTTGAVSYGATNVPYGSPYVLRMNVTNSSGQPCASLTTQLVSYACPSGALTVNPPPLDEKPTVDGVAGHYTLNSQGYSEDQPIQLLAGVYNFVANYAGDNSYTASTSPVVPITVTKAPTTITMSGLPDALVGPTVKVTVMITTQSNGAGPTGTVQFRNGGTPIGGASSFNGSGYLPSIGAYAGGLGSYTVSLPAGVDSIAVQYSGDGNYAGSTSAAFAISVADFSISANPTSIIIPAAGEPASSTLTLTPLNGFIGTVNLVVLTSCPAGTTCTVSPSSVNLTGALPVTATFTMATTASVNPRLQNPPPGVPPGFRLPVAWPWWLAALLVTVTLLSLERARRLRAGWLLVAVLLVVGVWAACGGGSGSGGGTPSPAAPAISFSPVSLTFGNQKVGTTSSPQSVTLSNTGTALLSNLSMGMGGTNSLDFGETNSCGSSVAVGANCTINVTFTPTAQGPRSAVINLNDNAGAGSQMYGLSGTATPPGAAPDISFSPARLTFGNQKVGTTSSPQSVTLSNTGDALLSGVSMSMGGPNSLDFGETNTCGSSVAAGANCTITVTFTPTAPGSRSAVIYLNDNAGAGSQMFTLSGTATGTAPGTYPISITAVAGNVEHSTTVTVTVQ